MGNYPLVTDLVVVSSQGPVFSKKRTSEIDHKEKEIDTFNRTAEEQKEWLFASNPAWHERWYRWARSKYHENGQEALSIVSPLHWIPLAWRWHLSPAILLPTYTWPHRKLGDVPLALQTPKIPDNFPTTFLRCPLNWLYRILIFYSRHYSNYYGQLPKPGIAQLPFGLILKYSDYTRIEEALEQQMAYNAGIPTPRIISVAVHPLFEHTASASILTTRLPGNTFGGAFQNLGDKHRQTAADELKTIIESMRKWQSPWDSRICSVIGTDIRTARAVRGEIPVCQSEIEFNGYLGRPQQDHLFNLLRNEEIVRDGSKLDHVKHPIVFTHGDLKHHNFMFHNGHISGIIDWESAGWYPDFWEFTASQCGHTPESEWCQFLAKFRDDRYTEEQEGDDARQHITFVDFV